MSRQNWSSRRFNPSNTPGTCLWCGRKLTPNLDAGNDKLFCTLVDAYSWAVTAANLGYRMVPKPQPALEGANHES